MRNIHLVFVTLCAFLLVACASAGGSGSGASGSAAKSSSDQSRLTSEEIVAANLPTAYDLVDRLRRPWLRRDAATGKEVVVYMDQQNLGGASKLRDIPSVDVAELQYLTYDQAVQRWGSQVEGSVILVKRRR